MKGHINRKYYNLSQVTLNGRKVYFRSTDIEQKNYHRLLWSIPDEWFYELHLGHGITVFDKSIKKQGKVERIFIPVLNDLLGVLLLGEKQKNKALNPCFLLAMKAVKEDSSLRRKIMCWKGKIKSINICAKTIMVSKEPNPIFK